MRLPTRSMLGRVEREKRLPERRRSRVSSGPSPIIRRSIAFGFGRSISQERSETAANESRNTSGNISDLLNFDYRHAANYVKPGNFLLTKSGQIKLSDFGLASIATTRRLTAAGRTVGTIQYMAPEQIRGKPALTGRADLYALGCVLFEMLTGYPPYSGENAASVLQQHLNGPIPHAAAAVLDCPLKLDQLICELMSKNSEQRPATAAEVGWRLEEILQPGRRAHSVEPEFFSGSLSKTRTVAPLQNVTLTPSDSGIPISPRFAVASSFIPWGMTVLLLMVCTGFWVRWHATATQLRHAEQQWVDLLEGAEPAVRVVAVNALGDFGPLQPSTIKTLRKATQDAKPEIRIAALSVLGRHAAECRWLQTEVMHIEKVDEHSDVRYHASVVLEAMKNAPAGLSLSYFVLWFLVLAFGSALAAVGWNVWQRLRPIALS